MMSFKEFVANRRRSQVLAIYPVGDTKASANAALLIEGGKTWVINKKWSVRQDRTHHDPTKTHTHIMFRGDNCAILNRDGTPSHNMPADNIPSWVMDRVKKMGLLESTLLVELSIMSVPAWVISRADMRAHINDLVSTVSRRWE
jgi:hypothetical protein